MFFWKKKEEFSDGIIKYSRATAKKHPKTIKELYDFKIEEAREKIKTLTENAKKKTLMFRIDQFELQADGLIENLHVSSWHDDYVRTTNGAKVEFDIAKFSEEKTSKEDVACLFPKGTSINSVADEADTKWVGKAEAKFTLPIEELANAVDDYRKKKGQIGVLDKDYNLLRTEYYAFKKEYLKGDD